MIDKVASILTNPTFVNVAQNTKATVTIESIFKATGRPAFIMMDNNVDKDTRKYAATKEGLYQILCLGIYLTMIPLVFKKYGFKLSQKILKNENCIPNFKNADEYLNYLKLANMPKENRLGNKLLNKISDTLKETPDAKTTLKQNLLTLDKPKKYEEAKGAIELSYLVGTVIGLALIASELSNLILHPIMRGLGLEKKPKENNNSNIKVDTQA